MERGYETQGTESQLDEDEDHGLRTNFFVTLVHFPVPSVGVVLE